MKPSPPEAITVQLNGAQREVPAGLSVLALLQHLEIPRENVAVELNRRVVRRAMQAETPIEDGDRIEIVRFVGGG